MPQDAFSPSEGNDLNNAIGTTADAAVTTNATGTLSGKLRGLVAILADVWNSVSHFFSVSQATLLAGEDQTNGGIAMFRKFTANTTYTATKDISAALEASTIAKASAGNLLSSDGRIDSTAPTGTYYIQWLDSATVPANGAVTHLRHPLKIQHVSGVDDYFTCDYTASNGLPATAGIVVCISTTEFTKTISSAYLSLTNLVA